MVLVRTKRRPAAQPSTAKLTMWEQGKFAALPTSDRLIDGQKVPRILQDNPPGPRLGERDRSGTGM